MHCRVEAVELKPPLPFAKNTFSPLIRLFFPGKFTIYTKQTLPEMSGSRVKHCERSIVLMGKNA